MSIPAPVADAINAQIHMEFRAFYLYLAMSAWFEDQNLPGFAHWMRLQSSEEREHALRLIDHMLDREGKVQLRALDAPADDFGAVGDAVRSVADHERKVTGAIHDLYRLAGDHADYAAQTMLHWFIEEQVEEEKSAADLVARIELVESGGGSLLMVDKELAKRE